MNRLVLVGLNHTTAPLAVRERLAFPGPRQQAALEALRDRFPSAEVVLVSTCNRVELYAAREVHAHPRAEELVAFLADFHQVPAAEFEAHLYTKADRDALTHLFQVASSMDSMVLGETQILGQVREAYDLACRMRTAGPTLNPVFQRAIAVGKQVTRETALTEGRVSVASVAVNYARQIFDHFDDKTVLTIGAGKMTTLALTNFAALRPGRLLVCNRDPAKAAALALRFDGESVPFERLGDHLVAADIVISSTGATQPIITRAQVERLLRSRRYRPMFLIDIALPRDVEAAVGGLENVYLYNLDDLQQVVAATHTGRAGAVAAAGRIVEQQVTEFIAWQRQREMGPVIDQLYKRAQAIAAEEVARTLNKLGAASPAERAHMEDLARRIVNKLLHDPVRTLRDAADSHGAGAQYLHALERLFRLEPAGTNGEADPAEEDRGDAQHEQE